MDTVEHRFVGLDVPIGGGCPHCVGRGLFGLVQHHLWDLLLDALRNHADFHALSVSRAARVCQPLFSPVVLHHLHGRDGVCQATDAAPIGTHSNSAEAPSAAAVREETSSWSAGGEFAPG